MSPFALGLAGAQVPAPQTFIHGWPTIAGQFATSKEVPGVLGSDKVAEKGTDHENYIDNFLERIHSDMELYISMDVSNSSANPIGLTAQERIETIPTILENIENSPTLTPGPMINVVLRYASIIGDEVVIGKLLEKMDRDDIDTILLGDLPYKSVHYAAFFGREDVLRLIFEFLESKAFKFNESFFMSMVIAASGNEKAGTLKFLLKHLYSYSLQDVQEGEMKEARDRIVEIVLYHTAAWMKVESVRALRECILERDVRVDHDLVKRVAVQLMGCTWRDPCQTRGGSLCDREEVLEIVHLLFVLWDEKVNEDGYKFSMPGETTGWWS